MQTAPAPRYLRLVGVLMAVTFALRLWSVSRWSWISDDWIYQHDASSKGFLPFVLQTYNGHFMPGQFFIVRVLNTLAPLNHGVIAIVTATWAAALVRLWAVALRDLWGTRVVTWVVLLLVTLSPLMASPTMWWAAALQTLALQTCFAACLYYVARLLRTQGEAGLTGLVVSLVVGLLMWEKALFLVLPIMVILVHASPEPMRAALRRYRRVALWLVGVSAGYLLVFVAAVRLNGPPSNNAVRADPSRSLHQVGSFFYDLWAHLLAPGVFGGPWNTLPTATDFNSRPPTAVSILALVGLLVLVLWLLRRDLRAWLPLSAAVLYAATAWSSILFSSRFDVVSWYRLGYERYAIDAFVVLVVLLGEAAARPAAREDRAEGASWLTLGIVGVLAVSLCVGSITAVVRQGVSPGKAWLASLDRGLGEDHVTLVDRYAPSSVMDPLFWGDEAKLSYLLVPWGDRVSFQGPATELHTVDDKGQVTRASFSAIATAPTGPVADCGYAVDTDRAQTIDLEPDLFDFEWVLKVDAISGDGGTLVVHTDQDLEMPIPAGLSSQLLVFTGPVDTVELQMAPGSGPVCVTGLAIGSLNSGS